MERPRGRRHLWVWALAGAAWWGSGREAWPQAHEDPASQALKEIPVHPGR